MSANTDNNDKDQADELREIFNEITDAEETEEKFGGKVSNKDQQEKNSREIDVLQLPPRKEVHVKSNRVGLKVSKPFLRLIFIIVVIIGVLIGALSL